MKVYLFKIIFIFLISFALSGIPILAQNPQWVVYDTSNSELPSNHIYSLFIHNGDEKWMGTYSGLAVLIDDDWTIYNTVNSQLVNDHVYSIISDQNETFWLGTVLGLSNYTGNTWINYTTTNSSLPNNFISALAIDNAGKIIAGTWGGGITIFNGNYWTSISSPDTLVEELKFDHSGTLWCGTASHGIVKFVGNNYLSYISYNIFPMGNISSIDFDAYGNTWAGSEGGGFVKIDSLNNWTFYNQSNSILPTNTVTSIFVDSSNSIWIGTGLGVVKFDGNTSWILYDKNNSGLPDNHITAINQDKYQNIWIATYGGLAEYNENGIVGVYETNFNENMVNNYLLTNYPNPFNPTTSIEYNLPQSSIVSIQIFNSLGEKVKTLYSGLQTSGSHEIVFDGGLLPSGIYFYQIITKDFSQTKKCLLLK